MSDINETITKIGTDKINAFITKHLQWSRYKIMRELKAEFNLNPGEAGKIYEAWNTYKL